MKWKEVLQDPVGKRKFWTIFALINALFVIVNLEEGRLFQGWKFF